MCCRLEISPLDIETATAILATGMFRPRPRSASFGPAPFEYERFIPEEDVTVIAEFVTQTGHEALRLRLAPSITTYAQHAEKRIAGGVYFEIAARYAEKVGGEAKQLANVAGCVEHGHANVVIARYPLMPFSFERICRGFQEEFLRRPADLPAQ